MIQIRYVSQSAVYYMSTIYNRQ